MVVLVILDIWRVVIYGYNVIIDIYIYFFFIYIYMCVMLD